MQTAERLTADRVAPRGRNVKVYISSDRSLSFQLHLLSVRFASFDTRRARLPYQRSFKPQSLAERT